VGTTKNSKQSKCKLMNMDSVQKVLSSTPLNISFRRNLVGTKLRDWHRIVASMQDMNLQEK
jgi:hypothetical protein